MWALRENKLYRNIPYPHTLTSTDWLRVRACARTHTRTKVCADTHVCTTAIKQNNVAAQPFSRCVGIVCRLHALILAWNPIIVYIVYIVNPGAQHRQKFKFGVCIHSDSVLYGARRAHLLKPNGKHKQYVKEVCTPSVRRGWLMRYGVYKFEQRGQLQPDAHLNVCAH